MPSAITYTGTTTGKAFAGIVNGGLALQNARTTYLALLGYTPPETSPNVKNDNQNGLLRDDVHASYSLGRYIVGLNMAEIIVPKDMREEEYTLPGVGDSIGLTPWARRFALERLGITPCVHTFPVADGSRVLLLDTEDLTRLAQWLGALAYTRPLRTLLQGESVRALQTALPGVYPECLHELGWFLPDLPRLQAVVSAEEMPTVEQLTCVGHRLLFAHLSHLPEPLLRRFQLRFSPEQLSAWKPLLSWRCSDADRVLLQRLLKRVSPGGYDLCCC